jgi:hypothetical protein
MKIFKKFKFNIYLLLISLLLFSIWYFNFFGLMNYFSEIKSEDVLQANTSVQDSFGTFTRAVINQYPVIQYPDGGRFPFQARFATYRTQSPTNRFTHYLCSGNADTCSGYSRDPKFIRLRFNSGEKLVLFNYYGLFSVNDSTNTIKWQSTHIDRFRLADNSQFSNCNFKFDPTAVIPVRDSSNNNFYLYTRFQGLNNNTCLQFYDQRANSPSNSAPNAEIYLGYEVAPSGELNRNYNRVGTSYQNIIPANEGPFGPGPQNAVTFSTSPLADLLGCKQFDSSKRCTFAQGVASDRELTVAPTTRTEQYNCRDEKYTGTCPVLTCKAYTPTQTCDEYAKVEENQCSQNCTISQQGTSDCTVSCKIVLIDKCVRYKTVNVESTYNVLGKPDSTGALCSPNNHIYTTWINCQLTRRVCDTRTVNIPGKFSATLVAPTFSNFGNFAFNRSSWNTENTPADYAKFKDELENNNTDNALNYTKDLNNTVFTSNRYIFKVNLNATNNTLAIRRYEITNSSYNIGATSYINNSSMKYQAVPLGNTSNTNFSLDFTKDDILVMASGSTNPVFYRIKGFNKEGSFRIVNLYPEITRKLPSNSGGPVRSFGIVENGDSRKIYLVTNNQAFWSTLEPDIEIEDIEQPGYKNFQFNGNVFSKESLSDGFMFNPSSAKYRGSYVTSGSFTSSLKFKNSTNVSFNYPDILYTNLIGFTNFNGTNFRKYNFLYENVSTNDRTPLASSQYTTLNPNSPTENKFEIINISKGKGLKIDLTNQNLAKSFNKYILINSDSGNSSRINFYLDCRSADYSLICSGTKFNFKGSVLGQFYISGTANTLISDKRFIRIHENADLLINLTIDLKNRKYQSVSSTLIHLKYE